ncbi:MAG: GNAT family N-acetyltransferase [Lachnospiraceae bacterium]|nr:GNAT family N-acetyltransferase [Lachnospiraceae bacterium]
MMNLFYDDKKEQENSFRKMWKTVFGDTERYIDFYYKNMYSKNQVMAAQNQKEIVGMIHLNPYKMQVGKERLDLHYIVGVATLEKYRRQGIMREMLLRCMSDMAKNNEVFTYLMPANKAYYEPFDFAFVQSFASEEIKSCKYQDNSRLQPLKKELYKSACEFLNGYLRKHYKVYTWIDEKYLNQLWEECLCEDGEILVLQECGKVKGFCCYGQEDKIYIRQMFADDILQMKEEIAAYFPKKQIEITLDGKSQGKKAYIMVRILRLDLLLPMMKGKREHHFVIRIRDRYLEHQNGTFQIHVRVDGCSIEPSDVNVDVAIDILDLTKLLFGYDCEALLVQYPDFGWINPLSPVMIGEII